MVDQNVNYGNENNLDDLFHDSLFNEIENEAVISPVQPPFPGNEYTFASYGNPLQNNDQYHYSHYIYDYYYDPLPGYNNNQEITTTSSTSTSTYHVAQNSHQDQEYYYSNYDQNEYYPNNYYYDEPLPVYVRNVTTTTSEAPSSLPTKSTTVIPITIPNIFSTLTTSTLQVTTTTTLQHYTLVKTFFFDVIFSFRAS